MKITNFQTIYIAQTSEPPPSPILKREQDGVNLLGASWVPFCQTIVWLVFWVFIIRYITALPAIMQYDFPLAPLLS